MDELYRATYEAEIATARLNYLLKVFGDEIARRQGYQMLTGIDAIHFYLIEKYHWLPSVVRSMSMDDLRFCLEEEMAGFRVPQDAIPSKE